MIRNVLKYFHARFSKTTQILNSGHQFKNSCHKCAREFSNTNAKFLNVPRIHRNEINIAEMVEHLENENAKDIVVIEVAKELCYVDYFIIVSGLSARHLTGMAELTNKFFKSKKSPDQKFSLIEGKDDSEDWKCLDLGNMVVHFMLPETRETYELEKLWLLGYQHDDLIKQKPSFEEIADSMAFGQLNLMNQDGVNILGNSDIFDQGHEDNEDMLFDDDIELQNIFKDDPLLDLKYPGESKTKKDSDDDPDNENYVA